MQLYNQNEKNKKIAVIVGAGPAGLTAAYELLTKKGSGDIKPIIYEESDIIGGISRTVNYKGNRIDIGGHRFFSKNQKVMDFWCNVMPLQTSPAYDEILLGTCTVTNNNKKTDPELSDRVMLKRNRVSRIYYLRRFFDYPVSLSFATLKAMGINRTIKAGLGYIASNIKKKPETSLENFYINRFGKPLYRMFFEDYTEKVWGIHPSRLGADWGSQRVKGLSILAILKDIITKKFNKKGNPSNVETSLIEEFIYPKYGPGQLWETVAHDIIDKGGVIEKEHTVVKVHVKDNLVTGVTVVDSQGTQKYLECDYFLSSMPIKDLIEAIDGMEVPEEVAKIARDLPYRDFITVGLLVDKLKIKNKTSLKTYGERIPDTWIYVQERNVKLGRIQVFNNWSPYMVKDFKNTVWIGLEYFCNEGDEMWTMDDEKFISMAIDELASIGIIDKDAVIDSVRIKIKKAYPAYFGSYYNLDKIRQFLDSIDNLYCIGRNGQHRYNNMDHSMLTAMEAVNNIVSGDKDKTLIWNVNTEKDYHESK